MLELPEARSIADQLHRTIQGKTIAKVIANSSPHGFAFFYDDPAVYPGLLEGRTIGETRAWGGLVEIDVLPALMLFGDGVHIRYLEPGTPPPKKHQLLVEFSGGGALVCTVQMYGGMWAFSAGDNENPYYLVAKEKPSPLSDRFDEPWFLSLFEGLKPGMSAKAFLATEQRIPGLGNGVLQDILFNAGINPVSKIGTFDRGMKKKLFRTVKKTLSEMTQKGGRDTEKDIFGNPGGYRTILSAKTLQDPCPRCGSAVTRRPFLGGNVYFCPRCQS